MSRWVFSSIAVSTMAIAVSGKPSSAQRMAPSAEWTVRPGVLNQLSVAESVDRYSLRIPKGYEFQQANNSPPGVQAWAWAGPARRDGTKPAITMMLVTLTRAQQEQFKSLSLDQLADKLLGGVKRQRTSWKQEKNGERGHQRHQVRQNPLGGDGYDTRSADARIRIRRTRGEFHHPDRQPGYRD